MKTRKDEPRPDQWDGTDVEPGHPRNAQPQQQDEEQPVEPYYAQYSQGDRFS
jgi:hypothetical protein